MSFVDTCIIAFLKLSTFFVGFPDDETGGRNFDSALLSV